MADNDTVILRVKFDTVDAIKEAARLRHEQGLIKAAMKEVDTATEEGRLQYELYAAELKATGRELRNTTSLIDAHTRSIDANEGSYEQLYNAVKIAEVELKNLEGTIRRNKDGTLELTKEYFNASKKVDEARQTLLLFNAGIAQGRLNVGNYGNTLEGMRAKLADLQKVIDTSDVGSEQFKEARDEAERLRLAIDQTVGKVDEFGEREPKNPTKKAFEDATEAGGALASTFQLVSMAQSENSGIAKVQAQALKGIAVAQNVANIVKAKGAIIDTLDLARTKALVIAKRAYNVVVGQSSGALKVFRVALAGTGIGLIVIAIAALISNFEGVKKAVTGFINKFDFLKKAVAPIVALFKLVGKAMEALGFGEEERIEKQIEGQEKLRKTIEGRYDREIRLAQAAGKATEELEKEKLNKINESVKKQAELILRLGQLNGELSKEQKEQLDELVDTYRNNANEIEAIEIEKGRAVKDANDKLALDLLNIQAKREALESKSGKTSVGTLKQIAVQERNIALEAAKLKGESTAAIEAQYQLRLLEISKDSAEEQKKIAEQNNKTLADLEKSRIDLIQDAREKQIKTEQFQLKQSLAQYKGNSQAMKEIRENLTKASNQRITEINAKFDKEEVDRQFNFAKQALQNRLEQVKDNEKKKLEVRLEQLDLEAQAEISKLDQRLLGVENFEKAKALIEEKYRIAKQNAEEDANRVLSDSAIRAAQDKLQAELLELERTGQSTFEKKMQLFDQERTAALNAENLTAEQKLLIEQEYLSKVKALNKESQDFVLGAAAGTVNDLKEIFEESKQAQKGLSIAETLMSTYEAAQKAYTSAQVLPFPASQIVGVATAATATAAGLKRVQKIAKLEQGGDMIRVMTISGKPHSAGGETFVNTKTGQAIELEGDEGAYIMKKDAHRAIAQGSKWNQLFGGRSWTDTEATIRSYMSRPHIGHYALGGQVVFNDGGFAGRAAKRDADGVMQAQMIMEAIERLPAPVVSVNEIDRAQTRKQQKTSINEI